MPRREVENKDKGKVKEISIRFGAVSSKRKKSSQQFIPQAERSLSQDIASPVNEEPAAALTNTRGLANVNRKVRLRPATAIDQLQAPIHLPLSDCAILTCSYRYSASQPSYGSTTWTDDWGKEKS